MVIQEIVAYYSGKSAESLQGKIIGLVADLGVGKTYLIEKILIKFSKDFINQVSSPTFNLCNIYESSTLIVHHFDLYRIELENELYNIGLWESIGQNKILTFIEWANMFPDIVVK